MALAYTPSMLETGVICFSSGIRKRRRHPSQEIIGNLQHGCMHDIYLLIAYESIVGPSMLVFGPSMLVVVFWISLANCVSADIDECGGLSISPERHFTKENM